MTTIAAALQPSTTSSPDSGAPYQVNTALLAGSGNPAVKFMHCLPAFHDPNTTVGREIMEHATANTSSLTGIAAGQLTRAVPVGRLTDAVTPSSLLSFFSTLAAHEARVIPPIASSTARTAPPGAAAGPAPVTVLIRASPLSLRGHVHPGPFGEKIFRPNGPGITPGQQRAQLPASW